MEPIRGSLSSSSNVRMRRWHSYHDKGYDINVMNGCDGDRHRAKHMIDIDVSVVVRGCLQPNGQGGSG
jgi:hypothetical protein